MFRFTPNVFIRPALENARSMSVILCACMQTAWTTKTARRLPERWRSISWASSTHKVIHHNIFLRTPEYFSHCINGLWMHGYLSWLACIMGLRQNGNRLLANVNSRSRSLYAIARPSVCRLSVCLSSVTLVRPTQAVEIFGNIFTTLGTLAIHWHPPKILRRSSQGNPSAGGVKHKRGSKI